MGGHTLVASLYWRWTTGYARPHVGFLASTESFMALSDDWTSRWNTRAQGADEA